MTVLLEFSDIENRTHMQVFGAWPFDDVYISAASRLDTVAFGKHRTKHMLKYYGIDEYTLKYWSKRK